MEYAFGRVLEPDQRCSIPSDSDKTRQQQGRDLHWTDRKHIQNTLQPTHTQLQTRPE